uniref:PiggyBac transposable element-derived protein 3 n=1 Tax=Bactrocera latifrons TaxID=174628 RepID=A0A0K8WLQ8_BACLA
MRYAHQNNFHGFSLSSESFRRFLGILIFTSYHSLPSEKMYWCTDDDVDIQIVRNCMPKNRYLEIKRFLHFANNDNVANGVPGKDFKIKPLIEKLNENFLKLNVFSKQLSIDEQMVRYYGGHFLKQFIKGKPIRFYGFCYNIELYQGKKDLVEKDLIGVGEKVITSMVYYLENPEDHELYFDNFFSSFRLISLLSKKKCVLLEQPNSIVSISVR